MPATRSCRTVVALLACVSFLMPACRKGCTETTMDARDAALVDAGSVTSSAVLEARLTSEGDPLEGRKVEFHVETELGDELAGYARTDADGVARLDLKQDLAELVEDATSDRYGAGFRGRGKYCGSLDEADLDLVATP